jgi:predicted transcriptional regulator
MLFTMELGSEAPGFCENWPSDIYFYINDVELGFWTCPGDFADVKGRFTPSWWMPAVNSYGLLKHLSVNLTGSYVDGLKISDVSIHDLGLNYKSSMKLRLAVPDKARNIGGLTIFGKHFGNYNQDIKVKVTYNTP